MEIEKLAGQYVANIRALYLLHQNHHWLSIGGTSYGDHLLFERIYGSAQEHADQAAEKVIGLYGIKCIDTVVQAEMISTLLKKYQYKDTSALAEASKSAEDDFQTFSKTFYNTLEENDLMTLGMDDLIMAIANEREEAIYLLKQRIGQAGMNNKMAKMSAIADKFQVKLAQDMSGGDNLDSIGDQIKQSLITTLGLKAPPSDLDFTDLKWVTDPATGNKSISWKFAVSTPAAQEFNNAVTRVRTTNPSFSVARTITNSLQQAFPGTTVMPAQPIAIG